MSLGDWFGLIGVVVGVVGLAYGFLSDWNARKERGRLHSFLKGLRASVFATEIPQAAVLSAINDEMARLEPPKKPNILERMFTPI